MGILQRRKVSRTKRSSKQAIVACAPDQVQESRKSPALRHRQATQAQLKGSDAGIPWAILPKLRRSIGRKGNKVASDETRLRLWNRLGCHDGEN